MKFRFKNHQPLRYFNFLYANASWAKGSGNAAAKILDKFLLTLKQ